MDQVCGEPSDTGGFYKECSTFPFPSEAYVGPEITHKLGEKYCNVYTEWTYSDLERMEKIKFCRSYVVFYDNYKVMYAASSGNSTEIRGQLLSSESPSGSLKAVLTKVDLKGQQYLEVWRKNRKVTNVNLSTLDKHGKIYEDDEFGCLSWSHSENRILYVAEKKRPVSDSFFPSKYQEPTGSTEKMGENITPRKQEKLQKGDQFVFYEDWGEALVSKSIPVLCVLDLESNNISVLQSVPDDVSPGQAFWAPGDNGVIFVGWWHEPFRLGRKYCSNRRWEHINIMEMRAILFVLRAFLHILKQESLKLFTENTTVLWDRITLQANPLFLSKVVSVSNINQKTNLTVFFPKFANKEMLSSDTNAVWSPRLSPDKTCIAYLEEGVFGPHRQCAKLCMYNWNTKVCTTVLDIVHHPKEDEFTGIYCNALPPSCWSADSQRVVFSTPQRSRKEIFAVDMKTGIPSSLTAGMFDILLCREGSSEGSWTLLSIQCDLLVASSSSPNCPPNLKIGFLCPSGKEQNIKWVMLENSEPVSTFEWNILSITSPTVQLNPRFPCLDYEVILLKPKTARECNKFPFVVWPHGGPHSVFVSEWSFFPALLCQLGFAVLLVNYRGSLGFGQNSIMSLIGNVGEQDVKDVQNAVMHLIQEQPLDPVKAALVGKSHGGFICCHLIGQFPDFYKACAVMNPLVNLVSTLGITDITDWRYEEVGLSFQFNRLPSPEVLKTMLEKSPILFAPQVKTPVLLMVGEKDKRVPPQQGMEYFRALKVHGVSVRLLLYPDTNHSLSNLVAESDSFMNVALWIIKHLKK
ncbi:acylamino-acid-releasing enzyme-like [Protopterus annectens]|uniref:acylamino-acid-releasing enzyme-like n=1 Tax=Protopterus annectens TaxID=7888 RepID=UPI001CF96B76|nr:acylamino-acid-releasing enzyme-like [Protopterus annectens]